MDSISSSRDRLLISHLKEDNIESFETLYNTYQPKIFAFLLRLLKVNEDAEGMAQEVFIELWKNRQKIDINLSISSFLFTIAKNKTIDHFRKQQKQTLYNNYLLYNSELPNNYNVYNPEYKFPSKQIVLAIKKLPEKRRAVFLLIKKFGLSRREVADFMGISESTVKNQQQEALKFLRQVLNKESVSILMYFYIFLR